MPTLAWTWEAQRHKGTEAQRLLCRPGGFTLVEMLITITIIGMLAAIALGGLNYARQMAREAATKATIAKLHNIIMEKYESYQTRRAAITITSLDGTAFNGNLNPTQFAQIRLAAIRDLMRMEMPERWNDVSDAPASLSYAVSSPYLPKGAFATWQRSTLALAYGAMYQAKPPSTNPSDAYSHAKCLYMIVAANPENLEQFSRSEITVGSDGWPMFVDGWGKPIYFLRWAPAFSYSCSYWYPPRKPSDPPPPIQQGYNGSSDIQLGDAQKDHDPLDSRKVDPGGFKLIPLIYSCAGRDPATQSGVNMGQDVHFYDANNSAYWQIFTRKVYQDNGGPFDTFNNLITNGSGYLQNIHNHHIESK